MTTPAYVPPTPPAAPAPWYRRELTSLAAWSHVHTTATVGIVALLVGWAIGKLW